MKHFLLFASAALLTFRITCVEAAEKSAARPPNILVILTDDLGWADIGAQGINKDIRTPNIDALAAGGLRATNG